MHFGFLACARIESYPGGRGALSSLLWQVRCIEERRFSWLRFLATTADRGRTTSSMFSIVIPPLRPPRLTPEEKEPYCFTCGEQIGKGAFSVVYALSAPSSALAAKVMIKRDLPSEHVEQLVQETISEALPVYNEA